MMEDAHSCLCVVRLNMERKILESHIYKYCDNLVTTNQAEVCIVSGAAQIILYPLCDVVIMFAVSVLYCTKLRSSHRSVYGRAPR